MGTVALLPNVPPFLPPLHLTYRAIMNWQIIDRVRNYADPWRPVSYAIWGMFLSAPIVLLHVR